MKKLNNMEITLHNWLVLNQKFLKTMFEHQTYLCNYSRALKGGLQKSDIRDHVYMFILKERIFNGDFKKLHTEDVLKKNKEFIEIYKFLETVDISNIDNIKYLKLKEIIDNFFIANNINLQKLDIRSKNSNSMFSNSKNTAIIKFKKKMKINIEKLLYKRLDPIILQKGFEKQRLIPKEYIFNDIKLFNKKYLKKKIKIIDQVKELIISHNKVKPTSLISFETFMKKNFDGDFSYDNVEDVIEDNSKYICDLLKNDPRLNYVGDEKLNMELEFNYIESDMESGFNNVEFNLEDSLERDFDMSYCPDSMNALLEKEEIKRLLEEKDITIESNTALEPNNTELNTEFTLDDSISISSDDWYRVYESFSQITSSPYLDNSIDILNNFF